MIKPEFSRIYEFSKLADGESDLTLEATCDENAALAERFGLEEIKSLKASLHLDVDQSSGCVHVSGTLDSEIVQTCVVTLKPLPATIHASIVRNYVTTLQQQDSGHEIDLSEAEEDEPELISDEGIDFGEIVAEQLGLEMDPFPRTPGSEFPGFSSDSGKNRSSEADSKAPSGPFAALARLKEPKQK